MLIGKSYDQGPRMPADKWYIGDISRQDADVLARYAQHASRVLEFGVGASTHVLVANTASNTRIVSVDTSAKWIELNKKNLKDLGLSEEKISWEYYDKRNEIKDSFFDLIYNDGRSQFRKEFAIWAWPRLTTGGVMLFHDTRKQEYFEAIAHMLRINGPEIGHVSVNVSRSNITSVTKVRGLEYENWNVTEKKESWMQNGAHDRPDNWRELLKETLNPSNVGEI